MRSTEQVYDQVLHIYRDNNVLDQICRFAYEQRIMPLAEMPSGCQWRSYFHPSDPTAACGNALSYLR